MEQPYSYTCFFEFFSLPVKHQSLQRSYSNLDNFIYKHTATRKRELSIIDVNISKEMDLLHIVALLSICASSMGINDVTVVNRKNVFLSRKKRYLTFPAGSNLVISLSAVKAFTQLQPTGWNTVEELDFPFALPSDTRIFKRKNWINRTKREIRSSFDQGLTKSGLNGTACINKIICDMKRYIPMRGKSMMKDIILAVFSYTEEEFNYEERCRYSDLDTKCSVSILDYVLDELTLGST